MTAHQKDFYESYERAYERAYERSLETIGAKYGIRQCSFLAKGKRGVVFKGILNKSTLKGRVENKIAEKFVAVNVAIKNVAIKLPLPASSRGMEQEALILRAANKLSIGPKVIAHGTLIAKALIDHGSASEFDSEFGCGFDYVIMEFVDGKLIEDSLSEATAEECKGLLLQIFAQCRALDKAGIEKKEMCNPRKHIIVKEIKSKCKMLVPVFVDFERSRFFPKPKNVTQFCQYVSSPKIQQILSGRGIYKISKAICKNSKENSKASSKHKAAKPKGKITKERAELIELCKAYDADRSEKSYENILRMLSLC